MNGVLGADRFPQGSRIVLLSGDGKGRTRTLTEGFFAAADPEVNFTADRFLFAGQRTKGDHWQIWEAELDASGLRQITRGELDHVRPSYLPGDEIAYTEISGEKGNPSFAIVVAGQSGANAHAITFGPGGWWLETVLRDGRIVVSATWPLANGPALTGNRILYTLKPDGTALDSLRCEHGSAAVRSGAAELADGSIVFTETSGSAKSGTLMVLRQGSVSEEKWGSGGTDVLAPTVVGANELLVSRRAGTAKFQLWTLTSGQQQGREVFGEAGFDVIQTAAVEPREVPKKFWSTISPNAASGYFIALDSMSSLEDPARHSASRIERVRVLIAKQDGEEVLGEALVEKDGSFYIEVPANRAVRFELLDNGGNIVREEHGWIWSRPGEQRGCAGCHADKALAPENRWPMALRRAESPVHLTKGGATAPAADGHAQ